jgi:hypothetical protein
MIYITEKLRFFFTIRLKRNNYKLHIIARIFSFEVTQCANNCQITKRENKIIIAHMFITYNFLIRIFVYS